MKKIILIIAALIFGTFVYAQSVAPEVIASAGEHFTNANAQLSFTIGETIIETVTATNSIITQGFHQSTDSIIGIEEELPGMMEVNIYPNPVRDRLVVQLENNILPMNLELYDITGRKLTSQRIPALQSTVELNIASYANASYLLRLITDDQKFYATYTIQKTQ